MLICSSAWWPLRVQAQDTAVDVHSQQFQQRYHFFSQDVISQPLRPFSQYAIVEAGYRVKDGGYALAQDAAKQRELFFNTAGTRQLKKWLVSGAFTYLSTTKDSVGYTLRDDLNNPAPYYFYAGKKGNWQVISYQLQGTVSRSFLKDKFTAAAGISYSSNDGWRGNDPRSEYFTYHLATDASLIYHLLPKHKIGVAGGIIRKSTDTNLEYRNKDYQYSLTQPEYINYLQDGYGYVELKTGNTNIASNTKGWKLHGLYDGQLPIGSLTLKGGYTHANSSFFQKGFDVGENVLTYGYFYENEWSADAYWQYKRGKQRWSALVNYIHQQDKDYNTLLAGNNYVYAFEQLKVQPMFAHYKAQRLQYEVGLEGSVSDQFRADGSAGQTAEYQYATVGALVAWYVPMPPRSSLLKLLLKGSLQQPISADITQPAQQPAFTKAVIFRDYYYYNATVTTIQAEALYQFPIRQLNTFVKADYWYQNASIATGNVPATSLPGTNRWQWQLSLGFNL
ncbi:DUF6850 family outer membrane beta-barrel protein [Chitinophaga sp. 30R24]